MWSFRTLYLSRLLGWGIIELELYALVYCVKQLAPYMLGRRFTVQTDHKNLVLFGDPGFTGTYVGEER